VKDLSDERSDFEIELVAGCAQRFDEYCRDQGSYRVDVRRPRRSRSERHRNKVLSIGWDRVGSGSRSIRGRAPGVRGSGCGGETVAAAHVGDVVVGARGGGDPSAGLLRVGVRPGLGSHRRCRGRGSVLRVLRTRMLSNRSC